MGLTMTLGSSSAEAVDIDALSPDFIPSDATNGNSRTTVLSTPGGVGARSGSGAIGIGTFWVDCAIVL
jgi:hypothetical protein